MGSRRLPKGEALDKLAKEYRECPPDKIAEFCDRCAKQYSFASAGSFMSSMSKTVGVRREARRGSLIESHPTIHKLEVKATVSLRIDAGDTAKTVAIINDTHNPFQDAKTLGLVEAFLEELQPDYLIHNGDANDFYQISVFDKDPARVEELQSDVNNTRAMFQRFRKTLPNARMFLIEGNHENRWQKFLWTKAPELSSLNCLTIPELFSLKEYEIELVPYEAGLMINELFLVLHGDIASIHSGYTAKRMYEKHGGCGICAHCHRGGSFYKRDRFGEWGWWENFCLCSLYPDWIQNPNWTQGFSLVHFKGHRRFYVEQIPITKHAFMYGGKLYG